MATADKRPTPLDSNEMLMERLDKISTIMAASAQGHYKRTYTVMYVEFCVGNGIPGGSTRPGCCVEGAQSRTPVHPLEIAGGTADSIGPGLSPGRPAPSSNAHLMSNPWSA